MKGVRVKPRLLTDISNLDRKAGNTSILDVSGLSPVRQAFFFYKIVFNTFPLQQVSSLLQVFFPEFKIDEKEEE